MSAIDAKKQEAQATDRHSYDKQFRNGCWQIIKAGQPGNPLFAVSDKVAADRLLEGLAQGKTIKEMTQKKGEQA